MMLMTACAAQAQDCERWGVYEVVLESGREYRNPFTDVQLKGQFRCGDAEVVTVLYMIIGSNLLIRRRTRLFEESLEISTNSAL